MADWVDELYQNNWQELPDIDIEEHERAAQKELMRVGAETGANYGLMQQSFARYMRGYVDTVDEILEKLRTGELTLEELRRQKLCKAAE